MAIALSLYFSGSDGFVDLYGLCLIRCWIDELSSRFVDLYGYCSQVMDLSPSCLCCSDSFESIVIRYLDLTLFSSNFSLYFSRNGFLFFSFLACLSLEFLFSFSWCSSDLVILSPESMTIALSRRCWMDHF